PSFEGGYEMPARVLVLPVAPVPPVPSFEVNFEGELRRMPVVLGTSFHILGLESAIRILKFS
ncbi:MAG: hypothetical protein O7E52_10190, partial [Candidatus Poribacteria bacterium]|nr:hypothetical protein [Candidatus Poribacteria bacterium]